MSYVRTFRNAHLSFVHNLEEIMRCGEDITVRGQRTLELTNACIVIERPQERCYMVPGRNNNVFAQVAETLWMLAGRDDIEWLSYYLPRAKDFSDNGRTWRGAYGPRLRNWSGCDANIDQVSAVLDLLRSDPETRQAVMTIWEPTVDMRPGKDKPCNNWIHFFIRFGKLYMNLAQRSSDCMWGYSGIDTFSWSVLHELMARWLSVEIGEFTHFISSFHVYERHWDKARAITSDLDFAMSMYDRGVRPTALYVPFRALPSTLNRVFEIERWAREGAEIDPIEQALTIEDEFMRCAALMLSAYVAMQEGHDGPAAMMINVMPDVDLKYAATEYILRTRPAMRLFLEPKCIALVDVFTH